MNSSFFLSSQPYWAEDLIQINDYKLIVLYVFLSVETIRKLVSPTQKKLQFI
jgi:hypothetical protein